VDDSLVTDGRDVILVYSRSGAQDLVAKLIVLIDGGFPGASSSFDKIHHISAISLSVVRMSERIDLEYLLHSTGWMSWLQLPPLVTAMSLAFGAA
jgi:hypothetical protein